MITGSSGIRCAANNIHPALVAVDTFIRQGVGWDGYFHKPSALAISEISIPENYSQAAVVPSNGELFHPHIGRDTLRVGAPCSVKSYHNRFDSPRPLPLPGKSVMGERA